MASSIVIVGETGNFCLEMSYHQAAQDLGMESYLFDSREAILGNAKFGKLGRELHRFYPLRSWLRKGNKSFVEFIMARKPEYIILFTGAEILPGTIGYLRSISNAKIIWYWADPLLSLSDYILGGAKLSHLVASYSKASLPVFEQLGAPRTVWVPFAADTQAHQWNVESAEYRYDVSFTGSWRPEREKVLATIHKAIPGIRLRVDGPYWERCQYDPIRKLAGKKPLFGPDFSTIVSQSLLSLNVTDTTNYPAANMRFFEILASGGAELVSGSDEMKVDFIADQDLMYFNDEASLLDRIQFALKNPDMISKIRKNGHLKVKTDHLYINRLKKILENV